MTQLLTGFGAPRRRRPRASVPGRYGLIQKGRAFNPRHRPRAPLASRAPSAPAAPRAPGAATLPAAGPRPLFDDAQAAADRAAARFRVNQGTAEIDQQGAYDRTDFQEALRRMTVQRPKDEQATRETANSQGLFYSGQLGKRMGDLATQYAEREADQRSDFDRREAARIAARQALAQGLPIEEAAISAAAADRQIERDSAAADAGALVPMPKPAGIKRTPRKPVRRPKPNARKAARRRAKARARR